MHPPQGSLGQAEAVFPIIHFLQSFLHQIYPIKGAGSPVAVLIPAKTKGVITEVFTRSLLHAVVNSYVRS